MSVHEAVIGFMERHALILKIAKACFSLLFGALAMYFVYRWGDVLRRSGEREREIFLGPVIAEWISDGDMLALLVSLYLGFKMFSLLVDASRYKEQLEQIRRKEDARQSVTSSSS